MSNIDPFLLSILVCPETKQKVTIAVPALTEQLLKKLESGSLVAKGGHTIKHKFESGLIREDKTVFFPIRDGIPVMLMDEAIDL